MCIHIYSVITFIALTRVKTLIFALLFLSVMFVKASLRYKLPSSPPTHLLCGQFRGDGRTVGTLVFGVYKICCITGSCLWVIQKDITL